MKKIILTLLLIIGSLASTNAQTNSQVQTDISYTIQDFLSELNYINDDKENFQMNTKNIANTYGSPEYFLR